MSFVILNAGSFTHTHAKKAGYWIALWGSKTWLISACSASATLVYSIVSRENPRSRLDKLVSVSPGCSLCKVEMWCASLGWEAFTHPQQVETRCVHELLWLSQFRQNLWEAHTGKFFSRRHEYCCTQARIEPTTVCHTEQYDTKNHHTPRTQELLLTAM